MTNTNIKGYRLFENLIACLNCSENLIDTNSLDEVENAVIKLNSTANCSQCGKIIK